jgi:tetratricopeptide (TPR) repeat protein
VPTFDFATQRAGEVLLTMGEDRAAEQYLRHAGDLSSQPADIYARWAWILDQRGDRAGAARVWRHYAAEFPRSADAQRRAAEGLIQYGDTTQAISVYRDALQSKFLDEAGMKLVESELTKLVPGTEH